MRTTLTLDEDVVALLEDEVHRVRKPFKQVVNEAIRRGLAPRAQARVGVRYRVKPHEARLVGGIDRTRMNAFADELEDAALLAKASKASERRR